MQWINKRLQCDRKMRDINKLAHSLIEALADSSSVNQHPQLRNKTVKLKMNVYMLKQFNIS